MLTSDTNQKLRDALLTAMHKHYIRDVLNRISHNRPFFISPATFVPTQVANQRKALSPGLQEPTAIDPNTLPLTIFNQNVPSLLILSEAGIGKTTWLLQLLRDALAAAQTDQTQPIPIYYHLSRWKKPHAILTCLYNDLPKLHGIKDYHLADWLKSNQFLFILDGLDESPDPNNRYKIQTNYTDVMLQLLPTCEPSFEHPSHML